MTKCVCVFLLLLLLFFFFFFFFFSFCFQGGGVVFWLLAYLLGLVWFGFLITFDCNKILLRGLHI